MYVHVCVCEVLGVYLPSCSMCSVCVQKLVECMYNRHILVYLLRGEYSECVAILLQSHAHLGKHRLSLKSDTLSALQFLLPSLIKL